MIFWRVKSLDAILATAEKKSLHRSLGVWQLTLLGVGAIIGTGIFCADCRGSTKSRPRYDDCFCHCRFRLCSGRTLLFRAFFDGTGIRVCLYLFLRRAW